MNNIIVHAWPINQYKDNYYLIYTHWVYLKEISGLYNKVYLLSPMHEINYTESTQLTSIGCFENVEVIKLPASIGYIGAIRHFFSYLKAYRNNNNKAETIYTRYPTPFGWLQMFFFKKARRIIHFVGDPVDTIQSNPRFNKWKKLFLVYFFKPEHWMYLWACKGAEVYTNGNHIAEKLSKQRIIATPLISSTLTQDDFYFNDNKRIDKNQPKLLYIGYLRKAKGIETIINAFKLLKEKLNLATLTIVGSGEFEAELKTIVSSLNLTGVLFKGHIENREAMNHIIRTHDIFCFASISEGSPRVILEAMANGLLVVSTPVGSLPFIFEDNEEIHFVDYNDDIMFFNSILDLLSNQQNANIIRLNAYNKVKSFTIEKFIKSIFSET